jgi:hypothetical protein
MEFVSLNPRPMYILSFVTFLMLFNYKLLTLSIVNNIVFQQGTQVFLLAISSKDNTRVELERVEMDSCGFGSKDR